MIGESLVSDVSSEGCPRCAQEKPWATLGRCELSRIYTRKVAQFGRLRERLSLQRRIHELEHQLELARSANPNPNPDGRPQETASSLSTHPATSSVTQPKHVPPHVPSQPAFTLSAPDVPEHSDADPQEGSGTLVQIAGGQYKYIGPAAWSQLLRPVSSIAGTDSCVSVSDTLRIYIAAMPQPCLVEYHCRLIPR